jgi:hypothetical protein
MRPTAVLALLLLLACTPVAHVWTESPDEHRVQVRDASLAMGVRVLFADRPGPGVIAMEFQRDDARVCGVALERVVEYPSHPSDALTQPLVDCQPKAWSCSPAHFVAHELGHVLGLPHESATAMDPAPLPGLEFTRRQKTIMRAYAVGFAEVCGVPSDGVTDPRDHGAAAP